MSLNSSMDNVARALLRTAHRKGDSGTYYHKNDSGTTVYFIWGTATTTSDDALGVSSDSEEAQVTLPRFVGITGLEPAIGDVLLTGSQYWGVRSIQKLGLHSNPAAWLLAVTRELELNRSDG